VGLNLLRLRAMNKIGRRRHNYLAASVRLDALQALRELRIVDDFLPTLRSGAEVNDAHETQVTLLRIAG
jgi:hypothetical protein